MANIGFIGLGIMGKPMATNLLKAAYKLFVYDIDSTAVESLVKLGGTAASLEEIAKTCDFIFTILPNGAIVKDVLIGENGVKNHIKFGATVCDMSSITPGESQLCEKGLKEKGVGFVDAPVSGGEPGAINSTLAFMCGGSEADFNRLVPYFEIMGSSSILVGKTGSGSTAKLCNQIIVNLNIAAVSEAFVLASKAGVDPEKVYQAIRGGLAGSAVLDAKVPLIVTRNFKAGGKISINHKDIKNVLSSAHELDVPMPFSSQLFEIMQALKVAGHMDEDHGGIVQYFEKLAGVEVKSINTI